MTKISIIAAIGLDRGIGYENKLLWRIPNDLKHFKALTLGKPIIMGRKTFESIGRPLPGRQNIVVTRNPAWQHEGVETAGDYADALLRTRKSDPDEIFIIGGGELYYHTVPFGDRLYLTIVESLKPADTYFPPYEDFYPKVVSTEKRQWNDLNYAFVVRERDK